MNSSAFKIGRALKATLLVLSLSLPLSAQMGGGGMHGSGGNTPMENSGWMDDVRTNAQGMPGSPTEMRGTDTATGVGMNLAPFVNNNTVYTLTRERPSEQRTAPIVLTEIGRWQRSTFQVCHSGG